MIEEARIISAFKESGVKSVVVLDDAFDPPVFDVKYAGELLSYLEDAGRQSTLTAAGLGVPEIAGMREALQQSEYNAEILASGLASLYRHYRTSRQSANADPGGMFGDLKGGMLRDLFPLIDLLRKCDGLEIKELGKNDDIGAIESVDVVFADYFLLSSGEAADESNVKAVEASYQKVIAMVDKAGPGKRPSVILMSSQDVKEKAEAYRAQIRKEGAADLVYASSFGFVLKTNVKRAGATIEVAEAAADALLDVFQAFEFGRTVHASLDAWFTAARDAVNTLQSDVAKLQLREFAYLTKFRLIEEGEPLLEYLEWFFGECLLDGMAKAFDGKAQVPEREKIEAQAGRIEGAFDGPTAKIAELYHRVRIASPKGSATSLNYRLGDLFLNKDGDAIIAIMTPECDLILRKGSRKAKKLLTVSGELRPLNAPDSVISEFILIKDATDKEKPFSVDWKLKSVETRATAEHLAEGEDAGDRLPAPGASTDYWTYVGSLRPLYAQDLQKNLLVDLGRSSIPVGPALSMAVVCQLFVAAEDGKVVSVPTMALDTAHCWAIHSKNERSKPTLVFARTYASVLLKSFAALPEGCRKPPVELTSKVQAQFYTKLCGRGVELNDHCFGIAFVTAIPKKATGADFAWLVVAGLNESEGEAKPVADESTGPAKAAAEIVPAKAGDANKKAENE